MTASRRAAKKARRRGRKADLTLEQQARRIVSRARAMERGIARYGRMTKAATGRGTLDEVKVLLIALPVRRSVLEDADYLEGVAKQLADEAKDLIYDQILEAPKGVAPEQTSLWTPPKAEVIAP